MTHFLLGLLVGPFALSFESECAEAERPLMFWGKLLHLAAELTQQVGFGLA